MNVKYNLILIIKNLNKNKNSKNKLFINMTENLGNNYISYFNPISLESTKKIIESMEKLVCRILYKNKNIGTGFFCKIPTPGPKDYLTVLITNSHIINDNFLNQGNKQIIIKTRVAQENIVLNKQERKIFPFPQYGITMIEIKENDKINYFFDIDENNQNDNQTEHNENMQVYMIQNKDDEKNTEKNEVYVSYGTLKKAYEKPEQFNHTCLTFSGSSGSPVVNLSNNKLIGFQSDNVSGYFINVVKNKINFLSDKTSLVKELTLCTKGSSKDLKKKFTNGIDISYKKGFNNIGSNENKSLNSIIQMLSSFGEINKLLNPSPSIFDDNKLENNIDKYYNIYILSSFLRKAILESNQNGIENKKISLKQMNIILNFLDNDISKKSTYDFLLFILNTLHEELISYPDNIPRKGKLISFNSKFTNDIEESKNQFKNYYSTNYFKSMISELFNWIRREERFCSYCDSKSNADSEDKNQKFTYSFQAFPIILFDIDEIAEYAKNQKLYDAKPKSFNLQDMFNIYSLIQYKLDKEKEKCIFCKNGCLSVNYYIETSPKYFIIVINRKEKIGFTYGNKFELKEEEKKGIHYEYKQYELISVIMKDRDKCSCAVKNCEYIEITDPKEMKKITYEEWIKFQDENVKNITFENDKNNNKEIYDPYNAKILVYKGIKAN